jgi:hypothetical protein
MAQFEEVLFLLQFLFLVIVFFIKLVNLFNGWAVYDWKGNLGLFILALFLYGINLIVTPLAYESLYISQLSKLEVMPFLLIVLFTMIEAIITIQLQVTSRPRYTGLENARR